GQPAIPIIGGNGTKFVTLTGGQLPPGMTLNSSGSFSGSPTRHGAYQFSVHIVDCSPSTSCSAGTVQQAIDRALTMRVSAKDQQGGGQAQPPIAFGGPGGRKLAQTLVAGANGILTGVGLTNISCGFGGPVTIEIQRVLNNGQPDGVTIATGMTGNTANFNAIA